LELIVPCYNEAGRLRAPAFLELVASTPDTNLVFVDDGSRDGTAGMLRDLAAQRPGRISVLTLLRNAGKAEAIRRGFLDAFARGADVVGYWDADLATPLTALGEFIAVLESSPHVDIVMGSRVKMLGRDIRRSVVRHYCGRAFATATSLALGVGVYDTQCGAKLFRATDVVRHAFDDPFVSSWLVDVEILARYIGELGPAAAETRICELPLRAWTDIPGSKLKMWQAIRALGELAVVARTVRTRRSRQRIVDPERTASPRSRSDL
jgi:glycosyltransferase involved in cell wall biosynthesis